MGVTGLWTVVQPCARPVKLETLNRKRLAVDASIWIYQFLKAVRDKEGNALRNAHVVGFFRRICKLLFFGIKPVFVFDGGAPVLKRQTIAARKKRREGRREDAVRTAGKLLAIQIQRRAEEEQAKRAAGNADDVEEQEPLGAPNYVDEILMTPQERIRNRKFRKQDQYHLPDLETDLSQLGAPEDPRIMSQEELEEYARQFHNGEDINLYDFSKIDFDSMFFMSLPATDRYNILNAARIRSRLRMGYSKEQLDSMFPDRMAFSKFQIERVKERNDLTQRLMNLNGMNGSDVTFDFNSGRRIAGERGKEYVLVKNPDVEGGWALGVVGNKEGSAVDRPIDVDEYGLPDVLPARDDDDDDDAFEDVPIEGLNRLPKLPFLQKGVSDESVRRAETMGRRNESSTSRQVQEEDDEDALFFSAPQDTDDLFADNEDEDLQKAIAMSLEPHQEDETRQALAMESKSIAAPTFEAELTPESDDEDMDFTTALARSKQTQPEPKPKPSRPEVAPEYKFSGPLPFESLNINKRAKDELPQAALLDGEAGGFEKQAESKQSKAKKKAATLPPWFSKEDGIKQDFISDETEEEPEKRVYDDVIFDKTADAKQGPSPDVIDLDGLLDTKEVIDLESEDGLSIVQASADVKSITEEKTVLMSDIAEDVRANPPNPPVEVTVPHMPPKETSVRDSSETAVSDWEPTDDEREASLQKEQVKTAISPAEEAMIAPKSPSPEIEDDFEDVPPPPTVKEFHNNSMSVEHDATLFEEQDHTAVDEDYSDPEEEDLMLQLAAETEEHARFVSEFNNKTQIENAREFEQELKQLRNQQKKDRRDADEVSQIMVSECQQLLRLFGLPYITAPMEAEAQCAELVSLGLVDGIVTDDSDTFLFGGTRIYKNMFNQSKFVECFLSNDLEKEYALDRAKLIQFAHLLGSDYTEGIPGVGPVTALEIITEFDSLEEFRDWWMQVQMGVEIPNDPHQRFRKKFKKMATKIFLPPSFPDRHIDEAYLHPEVDSDPSEFQWGVPDLNGLRSFLMATIGWSQDRTDEVLVPVIRDMNKREQEGTQSNITRFMSGAVGAGAFAPRVRAEGKSRMDKAFGRLRSEAEGRKRGPSRIDADTTQSDAPADEEDSGSTRKKRKRKSQKK